MITPQTAQSELAKAIGVNSLYFKREDLHPLGSHKGRSIPVMIDHYLAEGFRHFVISSSGNGALAAGLYINSLNDTIAREKKDETPITLEIFAGKNITQKKLTKLQALKTEHVLVSIQERPLQTVFTKTQDPSVKSLRQSNDDLALVGYESLATELLEIPNLAAVFVPTSSGTTAEALAQYFLKHSKKNPPEVHIVQTLSCHPLADAFGTVEETDEVSIADAIVDKTALRKDAVVPLIEQTAGFGWTANNESIMIAQDLTKKHANGLALSSNSALSVAGLMNATYTGKKWTGPVVCLITGE